MNYKKLSHSSLPQNILNSSSSFIIPVAFTGSTISTKSGVSSVLLRTSPNASFLSLIESSVILMEISTLVSPTPNVTLMTSES